MIRAEYKNLLRERDAIRKALFFRSASTRGTVSAAARLAQVELEIVEYCEKNLAERLARKS